MKLTIDCNAYVDLPKLLNLLDISGDIYSYGLDNDLLQGNVGLVGNYKNTDGDDEKFEKIVPITVVFKDENVIIDEINIKEIKYDEVFNAGINCSFIIDIEYDLKDENSNNNEIEEDDDEKENEKLEDLENIKDEITKKYDKELESILLDRSEVFEESNKEVIEVSNIEKEDNRVSFKNIRSSFSKITVYYPKSEKEIDSISVKENKSIEDIYNQNQDYESKRRIIIK